MTAWQPGGNQPSWQPGPASPQPAPQPWGAPYPQAGPPVSAENRAPWPLPPAPVWTAAVAALATVVLLIVLAATGGVKDVVVDLGLRPEDASVMAGLLATMTIAGLLGGAVGVLTGRGGGLLRTAAGTVGLLALLAVIGSAIAQRQVDWTGPVFGALVLVGAALAAGPTLAGSARAWAVAGERRSAERVIARLSTSSRRPAALSGRGVGSLLVSLALVAGAVLAGVFVSTSLAPDTAAPLASGAAGSSTGSTGSSADSGAAPIPVGTGDGEYSSYLDSLARDCAAGSLTSCDDLFWQSEGSGAYDLYGSTCGGRAAVEYSGNCEALYHD